MSDQNSSTAVAPSAITQYRSGLAAALGAFAIWGVFPLYLALLAAVPALQFLAHRVVWCCLFVVTWVAVRGELGAIRAALANPVTLRRLVASGALISINWLTYVWAVKNGHVIDASLGYFINPLVSVVLGVVVLSERLNRAQWTAVSLAVAGVAYLTFVTGRLPWIALVLALSFGLYGLIRKVVAVESLPGLATETLLLTPLAAGYLAWLGTQGTGAFRAARHGHGSAAARQRDRDRRAAGVVRLRRAAHPAVDGRAHAVHRPHDAAAVRRVLLRRAVPAGPRRRVRADLVRARDLCRRRVAPQRRRGACLDPPQAALTKIATALAIATNQASERSVARSAR